MWYMAFKADNGAMRMRVFREKWKAIQAACRRLAQLAGLAKKEVVVGPMVELPQGKVLRGDDLAAACEKRHPWLT